MDPYVEIGAWWACDGPKIVAALAPNACGAESTRYALGCFVILVWSALALFTLWRFVDSAAAPDRTSCASVSGFGRRSRRSARRRVCRSRVAICRARPDTTRTDGCAGEPRAKLLS